MKMAILFAATVLLQINLFSQSQLIGGVKKIPMVAAQVYKVQHSRSHTYCGEPAITIKSSNPNVFSISNGTVKAIFDIGGSMAILVKGEDLNFYCYSFLDTIYFSKDNYIKTGDLMGKSLSTTKENLYEINIMMINEKGTYLSEEKIWDLIEKVNIVPIAHRSARSPETSQSRSQLGNIPTAAVCDAVAAQ